MLRCYLDENTTIVINELDSIVGSMSCFVNRGMKDDIDYINGTAHLTEHLIAKSIYISNKPYAFSNANVDKEYTRFFGQALSTSFNDLFNAIINLDIDFSFEKIEREKQHIWNQENYKLLNNFRLLDLEKMEYNVFGEKNKLHMPTLVTREDFFKINAQMIKKYIREKMNNSEITFFLSINPKSVDIDSLINKIVKIKAHFSDYGDDSYDIFSEEELSCMRKRNTLQIKKYKPRFFMSAFKVDSIQTVDEYMAINCLTVLYKVILNRFFEQTPNKLLEVSLKIYDETALLILYSKKREDFYKILSAIDFKDVLQVLDDVKRSLLFLLIERISNPIELHRFQFKTLKFYDRGTCFEIDDLYEIFEKITINKLIILHKRCLASTFYQFI